MMSTIEQIKAYYDKLAPQYDQNRFGNSYGQFIDQQERSILADWLAQIPPQQTVDLGCGTGRLLNFAHTGIDFSPQMLVAARKKHPNHKFYTAPIQSLPVADEAFQAAFATHVFMHLPQPIIQQAFREVARIIAPNGIFIFDIPSLARRELLSYQKEGWHGNTALSLSQIQSMCGKQWTIEAQKGILFLPIHRIPTKLRPLLRPIDRMLNYLPFGKYASYHFIKLRRTTAP